MFLPRISHLFARLTAIDCLVHAHTCTISTLLISAISLMAMLNIGTVEAVLATPAGLNPSDQFRWAFISRYSLNVEPSINAVTDANIFVNSQAEGFATNVIGDATAPENVLAVPYNPLTKDVDVGGWKAIVSGNGISALDNTSTNGTGVPIYRIDGVKVADDYNDLWDGSIDATISIAQTGEVETGAPQTGTLADGTIGINGGISAVILTPRNLGDSTTTNAGWINNRISNGVQAHIYALSSIQTVPAAVPEPGTYALLSTMLGAVSLRRKIPARQRNVHTTACS